MQNPDVGSYTKTDSNGDTQNHGNLAVESEMADHLIAAGEWKQLNAILDRTFFVLFSIGVLITAFCIAHMSNN